MKSHELATDLEKLAEHLKQQPDLEIGPIELTTGLGVIRPEMVNIAAVMPKPLAERKSQYFVYIENPEKCGLRLRFCANIDAIYKIVSPAQPAVFEGGQIIPEAELTQ